MDTDLLVRPPVSDSALAGLLRRLEKAGYRFVTPAPLTHRRILIGRGLAPGRTLQDVFGWNMPFARDAIDPGIVELMDAGGILGRRGRHLVSTLRVASEGPRLFLHSAYPTRAPQSVFFGPDSYRFADFIRAELPALLPMTGPEPTIVDIGAGSGVGGLAAASLAPSARLILADINDQALRLARMNAALAGQPVSLHHGDGLPPSPSRFDLVLANPPYIGGRSGRTYRDGGADLGREIAVKWAADAAARLSDRGALLLYSGAPIVRGQDGLRSVLAGMAERNGCSFSYREIDPDVFPATLLNRAYWGVERIAAVGAVLRRTP